MNEKFGQNGKFNYWYICKKENKCKHLVEKAVKPKMELWQKIMKKSYFYPLQCQI